MVRAGDPSSLADEILFAKDMPVQDLVDLVILVFVTETLGEARGRRTSLSRYCFKYGRSFQRRLQNFLVSSRSLVIGRASYC